MKDKINAQLNDNGFLATANDDYKFNFKKNGKVDLNSAPEGFSFTPYPLYSKESIKQLHLDPRFVMKHKFSGTTILSFFFIEESGKSEQNIKAIKKEISYNERRAKDTSNFSDLCTTDDDGEIIDFDSPGSNDTEREAMGYIEQEDIKDELHRMDFVNIQYNKLHPKAVQKTTRHVDIFVRYFIWMDTVTEIAEELGMSQSTVSRSVDRINEIIKKYEGEE